MTAGTARLAFMVGYTKGTAVAVEIKTIRAAFVRAIAAIRASPDPAQAFNAARELGDFTRQLSSETADFRASLAATLLDANMLSLAQLAKILHVSRARAHQLVLSGRKGSPVTDPGTNPEPASVTAAIIVHDKHVLIAERIDKIPPYTFPAGEMLPGESPAQTIIRKVPHETGINITPEHIIGRRIHPRTGRVMIYMMATANNTDTDGNDPDLASVKWATIAETRECMPDMFPPVREYLDSLE